MIVGSARGGGAPRGVPDRVFCAAFTAARAGCSDVAWESLAPREKTRAIYREMRRLDHNSTGEALRSVAAPGCRAAGSPL